MFDVCLLGQNPGITNWMTPIWLLAVGISIGFVLVLFALGKIWLFSRIALVRHLAASDWRFLWGGLTSVLYAAIGIAAYLWMRTEFDFQRIENIDARKEFIREFVLCLLFLVPISCLLGFGVFKLCNERGSRELFALQQEGFLRWLNWVCMGMIAFAIVGYGLAGVNGFGIVEFVDEPYALLNSATRLPLTGQRAVRVEIPPSESRIGGTVVPVSFYGQEVRFVMITTDQPLEVATEPIGKDLPVQRVYSVGASSEKHVFFRNPDGSGQIPDNKIDQLYVLNIGNSPANFTFEYLTQPVHVEVWIIPWAAVTVVLTYVLYWVCAVTFPKVFAIAYSTFKTEVNQPLFTVVLLAGLIFIMVSIWIPYYTFNEDIKMYKDSGLTLVRVLAIFIAIWAAGKSVAEEIEGQTALTVLSKPVGRREFIFGKVAGIGMMVALFCLLLGLWFVLWTAYKPIYDGREQVAGQIEWQIAFQHSIGLIPAVFLVFLEVLLFVVISVTISTRMGLLPNFLICFAIYVVGHLTTYIVQSAVGEFEVVRTFANLISIVFPVLDHFDVQASITNNSTVPIPYLAWAVIYTVLYGSVAMLLALILFEDRDLA